MDGCVAVAVAEVVAEAVAEAVAVPVAVAVACGRGQPTNQPKYGPLGVPGAPWGPPGVPQIAIFLHRGNLGPRKSFNGKLKCHPLMCILETAES